MTEAEAEAEKRKELPTPSWVPRVADEAFELQKQQLVQRLGGRLVTIHTDFEGAGSRGRFQSTGFPVDRSGGTADQPDGMRRFAVADHGIRDQQQKIHVMLRDFPKKATHLSRQQVEAISNLSDKQYDFVIDNFDKIKHFSGADGVNRKGLNDFLHTKDNTTGTTDSAVLSDFVGIFDATASQQELQSRKDNLKEQFGFVLNNYDEINGLSGGNGITRKGLQKFYEGHTYIRIEGPSGWFAASPVAKNKEADTAILEIGCLTKMQEESFGPNFPVLSTGPRRRSAIVSMGIVGNELKVSSGSVLKQHPSTFFDSRNIWSTSAPVRHGTSGGPVFEISTPPRTQSVVGQNHADDGSIASGAALYKMLQGLSPDLQPGNANCLQREKQGA